MLSAAVVSVGFRQTLLSDPISAVTSGYNGERFNILPDELAQVLAIRANTLAEFAAQLLERLWFHRLDEGRKAKKEMPANGADQSLRAHEEPVRLMPRAGEPRFCGQQAS